MNYNYFYGSQAESYSFIRVPRLLMTGEEFKGLSTDAKLLYALLLDRMGLSMRNGWMDEKGRVFIYYTVDEIQEDLNCGHGKACKLLAELDTVKGIGLIERKKQGQGKPTKIYVKQFAGAETASRQVQPKGEILHDRNPDDHTPENGMSGKQENGVQDVLKPDGNYTDKNNTENSYTDPSIDPSETEEMKETVREQIDYPLLAMSYMNDDADCILELICHVLCSTAPDMKIGSETIPTPKVQVRFRRLRFEHAANESQLSMLADALQAEIDSLVFSRQDLYRRKRRGEDVVAEISEINLALRPQRRELRCCQSISASVPQVHEHIRLAGQAEEQGKNKFKEKEVKQHGSER